MGLKWTELLVILVIVMLLFGTTRLPQLGKSLGMSIRNFKRGFSGEEEDEEKKLSPGEQALKGVESKSESKQS